MKMKEEQIIGTINPIEWDDEGNVKTFSIYSLEEQDYIIENYPHQKKLKRLLNKKVKAIGRIRKDQYNETYISLKKLNKLRRFNKLRALKEKNIDVWTEEFELLLPKYHTGSR